MKTRTESDYLGEIEVPSDCYWGAQTQRALENFQIGNQQFPRAMLKALGLIKKAAAMTNHELGKISSSKAQLIVRACDEVIEAKLDRHFPLKMWQSGSGTQTNMNINEVVANRANELAGQRLGTKTPIHPNDDVNMSQSTNDVFPSSMHLATIDLLLSELLPNIRVLIDAIDLKAKKFAGIIKVGRTHLMDATPITLGQEFSAYAAQLRFGLSVGEDSIESLYELALGGSSVGTGLNTHPNFSETIVKKLSELTAIPFRSAPNKFMALASQNAILKYHNALKILATNLIKIANDIRLLASGPRCGLGELVLPINEPGSSIMPGKVNPTQCEALTMVAAQVIGNDVAVSFGASSGQLQLNTNNPLIIHNVLVSTQLLSDACRSFAKNCVSGIEPNRKTIKLHLDNSLMIVAALNEQIGYENAAQIAKKAFTEGTTIKEAALSLRMIDGEEFERIVRPEQMVHPE